MVDGGYPFPDAFGEISFNNESLNKSRTLFCQKVTNLLDIKA